jgi:hypothetical protein
METSTPNIINEVIENIILTTDNNNQTPINNEKDNTTNTFDMEIDNVTSSSSNSTENEQNIPPQTVKDSMHAKQTNNTDESKSTNTSSSSKGKNKQTWSDEMDEAEASTSNNKNAKDRQFQVITAPTRFYATDNATDIKGKTIAEKRNFINALFIHFNGFQGSNYLSKNRKFIIYFDSLENLTHAVTKVQETQHNPIFLIADPNAKQLKLDAEKGRTIKVSDIPLFFKSDVVRNFFAKFGTITCFSLIVRGPWQIAFIVYENNDSIKQFYNDIWSVSFLEFALRVEPTDLDPLQTTLRQQFELKLTGLPFNTDQRSLQEFLTQINAKSCFIPRDQQYRLRPYAFINFGTIEDLDAAAAQHHKFKGNILYWMDPANKHCRKCGSPDHEIKDCPKKGPSNPYKPLYDRFKPEQYKPSHPRTNLISQNNLSYADAIRSKPIDNNKLTPIKGNISRTHNTPSNTVDAIHSLIARIDNIDNKLMLLSDEIILIKNEVLEQRHNQGDIDHRLSRLEFFTEIPDDEEESPPMDIVNEQPQHTLKKTPTNDKQSSTIHSLNTVMDSNITDTESTQNEDIATPRIRQVENELGNLRSELRAISLALRQALPTINPPQ